MSHRIIDTNVPLTAGGYNHVATPRCQATCNETVQRILKRLVIVVIDEGDEVLREYANNVRPDPNGNPAEQLLMHILLNRYDEDCVLNLRLTKNAHGQFIDYPDNAGEWRTDEPRCRTFDEDDKKWVALAVRFRSDNGHDAPIANAADRCWLAFRGHLEAAGVVLDFLCQPSQPPVDARA